MRPWSCCYCCCYAARSYTSKDSCGKHVPRACRYGTVAREAAMAASFDCTLPCITTDRLLVYPGFVLITSPLSRQVARPVSDLSFWRGSRCLARCILLINPSVACVRRRDRRYACPCVDTMSAHVLRFPEDMCGVWQSPLCVCASGACFEQTEETVDVSRRLASSSKQHQPARWVWVGDPSNVHIRHASRGHGYSGIGGFRAARRSDETILSG